MLQHACNNKVACFINDMDLSKLFSGKRICMQHWTGAFVGGYCHVRPFFYLCDRFVLWLSVLTVLQTYCYSYRMSERVAVISLVDK